PALLKLRQQVYWILVLPQAHEHVDTPDPAILLDGLQHPPVLGARSQGDLEGILRRLRVGRMRDQYAVHLHAVRLTRDTLPDGATILRSPCNDQARVTRSKQELRARQRRDVVAPEHQHHEVE